MKEKQWFFLSLVCGLLGVAFYFSGLFVLFTPLSFFYAALREGKRAFWGSILVALLTVLAMYHWLLPVSLAYPDATWQAWVAWPGFGFLPTAEITVLRFFGFAYFGYYGLISLFLSIGIWKKLALVPWGGRGILIPAVFLLGSALVAQFIFALPVLETVRAYLTEVLDAMTRLEKDFSQAIEMSWFLAHRAQLVDFVVYSLPGIIVAMTTLTFLANLWAARIALKMRSLLRSQADFLKLQIPFHLIWVVIAAGSLFFANAYLFQMTWLKFVAINLLLMVVGFYFFQGLSVLLFFARKRSFWFRFSIYGLLLFFLQTMSAILVGIGFADVWFDFRRLNKTIS